MRTNTFKEIQNRRRCKGIYYKNKTTARAEARVETRIFDLFMTASEMGMARPVGRVMCPPAIWVGMELSMEDMSPRIPPAPPVGLGVVSVLVGKSEVIGLVLVGFDDELYVRVQECWAVDEAEVMNNDAGGVDECVNDIFMPLEDSGVVDEAVVINNDDDVDVDVVSRLKLIVGTTSTDVVDSTEEVA